MRGADCFPKIDVVSRNASLMKAFQISIVRRSAKCLALVGISAASNRLWEYSSSGQVLQMPFRRGFRFPSPEDPSGMLLVSVELSVDEGSNIVLIVLAEILDGASIFTIA